MKHFEVKKAIIGNMGGKVEQEPAKLNPPDPDTAEDVIVNNMTFQTVDVISEGPIEGFVDESGENVTGDKIPQAIFLDEVPMMNPSGSYNFQRFAYDTRLGYSNQDAMIEFSRPSMEYNVGRQLFGAHIFHNNSISGNKAIKNLFEDLVDKLMGHKYQEFGEANLVYGMAKEGYNSIDTRSSNDNKDFSRWWNRASGYIDEVADPITHIVKNKDCCFISFTLGFQQLFDTCSIDGGGDGTLRQRGDTRIKSYGFRKDYKAGVNYATICEFDVELGRVLSDGTEEVAIKKHYVVYGMCTSQTFIDFGSNSYFDNPFKVFNGVVSSGRTGANMDKLSFPEDWNGKETVYKFLRVAKTTPETYSVLIKRSVYLSKVTEYSPLFFQYPLCALGAVKSDARTFSNVPKRAYMVRLMKMFTPNNYQPMITEYEIVGYEKDDEGNFVLDDDGEKIPIYVEHKKDRRRYIRAIDKPSEEEKLKVYDGSWDYVTLVKQWTDNPVWIVLDLLTNSRYGLGSFISMEDIDMFSFYETAKYCDGVDENGNFVGFSNGFGGLEPRYSFSAVLKDRIKTLEVITSILGLIDASLYWNNGKISLTHREISSRIRAIFNNRNVVDGVFIYTSLRRDERYNLVEVNYNDENDLYKTKVEYRTNESDLKDNGVFKISMNAWGCCSKGMAQRIGDRFLSQVSQDVNSVTFYVGNEALFLQLNDLFMVDDDLMNLTENYARLLDVSGPDSNGNLIFTVDTALDLERAIIDNEISLYVYRSNPNSPLGPTGSQTPETIYHLVASSWEVGDNSTLFYVNKKYVGPELGGFYIGSMVSIVLRDNSTQIYRLSSLRDNGDGNYCIVGTFVSKGEYQNEASVLQNHYVSISNGNNLPIISDNSSLYNINRNYEVESQNMADDEYDEMMGILPAPENLKAEEIIDEQKIGYLKITWDSVEHADSYLIRVKNSSNQVYAEAKVRAGTHDFTFRASEDRYKIYIWTLNADGLSSRYPSTVVYYFVDSAMALRSPEITILRAEGRK